MRCGMWCVWPSKGDRGEESLIRAAEKDRHEAMDDDRFYEKEISEQVFNEEKGWQDQNKLLRLWHLWNESSQNKWNEQHGSTGIL